MRFKDSQQVKKLILNQVVQSNKKFYRALELQAKEPPLVKDFHKIRTKQDQLLVHTIKLIIQELNRINLNHDLRDINALSTHMVKKHFESKKKYGRLMTKLYERNKPRYEKTKSVIETIERDYPLMTIGVTKRIEDCESKCGGIGDLKLKNREIARGLDNLLINWTKSVFSAGKNDALLDEWSFFFESLVLKSKKISI